MRGPESRVGRKEGGGRRETKRMETGEKARVGLPYKSGTGRKEQYHAADHTPAAEQTPRRCCRFLRHPSLSMAPTSPPQ